MKKDKLNVILTIVCVLIIVVGIVFLAISIFSANERNWVLGLALGCIIVSNILNLIRIRINK